MTLISQGIQDNTNNKRIAESFSIGLTLLHSGLLWDASELYNIFNATFNSDRLQQKVAIWRGLRFRNDNGMDTQYSRLLTEIVAGMVVTSPNQRLTSQQIL